MFTRPEVVQFMLDLAGYTADHDLATRRLLEPSFGEGEFLLAAVGRLLQSYLGHGGVVNEAHHALSPCIAGVELH